MAFSSVLPEVQGWRDCRRRVVWMDGAAVDTTMPMVAAVLEAPGRASLDLGHVVDVTSGHTLSSVMKVRTACFESVPACCIECVGVRAGLLTYGAATRMCSLSPMCIHHRQWLPFETRPTTSSVRLSKVGVTVPKSCESFS